MKNAKKEQASWGGRFSKGPSRLMLRFSESVSFDRLLAEYAAPWRRQKCSRMSG